MLSILIPVYNYDVRTLVCELHIQATSAKVPFEIIVLDDASKDDIRATNRGISKLERVIYKELNNNIGRSKIRNLLSSLSQFNNLLFIDCDAKVQSPTFIANYLNYCNMEDIVICGGISYTSSKPHEYKRMLRWQYGRKRESIPAITRNLKPTCSFTSFNFLASKSIFKKLNFNESISSYGYEDTVFCHELRKNSITISHIDNPLIHLGIDTNEVFINKSITSIKTLSSIVKDGLCDNELRKEIKLLSYYNTIKHTGLKPVAKFAFNLSKKQIEHNLLHKGQNLFYYDLFRLGYLCSL